MITAYEFYSHYFEISFLQTQYNNVSRSIQSSHELQEPCLGAFQMHITYFFFFLEDLTFPQKSYINGIRQGLNTYLFTLGTVQNANALSDNRASQTKHYL